MDAEVTLVIKSANQVFPDHRVEYHTEWTVLDLKREISKSHPGMPSVLEQRLIYSGQLLQDHLTLKEVLRHPPENNAYTIHMVSSVSKNLPVTSQSEGQPRVTSSAQPPVVLPANDIGAESITDGIRRRVVTTESSSSPLIQPQGLESQALYPHFSQVPTIQGMSDPLQQMAAMQQMYAQYMASYMQYMQAPQQMSQGIYNAGLNNEQTEQNNSTPPPQAVPNNPQPPQAPNLAAALQAGVDEDEDGAPRDWLDYVYYASRMGVLLSIVYFYSTLSRFVLIIVIIIGLYLYKTGFDRGVADAIAEQGGEAQEQRADNNRDVQQPGETDQPDNQRPQPAAEQPGPAVQGDQSAATPQTSPSPEAVHHPETSSDADSTAVEEREADGGSEEAAAPADSNTDDVSGERDVISEELMSQRPSILTLSWTFLTTFFTSLIPENHNQIIA